MHEHSGTGRIPMADDGEMSDAQQAVYRKIVNGQRGRIIGPLRVALHSPELADRWQSLGEFLRFQTRLPETASELAIIATGRYWNSQVEWMIHASIAERAGLAPAVIEAIRTARPPEFDNDLHAAVYEFTRALLENAEVDDDVYTVVREIAGDAGIVELTALIGYYTMVAMTLNVHRVPVPDGELGRPLDLPDDQQGNSPTRLPPGRFSETQGGADAG